MKFFLNSNKNADSIHEHEVLYYTTMDVL